MSKFHTRIRESLDQTDLKRVRVTYMDGYTGYILEEEESGHAIIYIVGGGDPEHSNQLVRTKQYEELDDDEPLNPLDVVKELSVEYLMQKGLITCQDKDKIDEVMLAPCIHGLEKVLRSFNITDIEILNLIKPAVV
tara:strand:- start:95 stop:502 length:408 start_codon:yes stop_codon:yes gene_type:complete